MILALFCLRLPLTNFVILPFLEAEAEAVVESSAFLVSFAPLILGKLVTKIEMTKRIS